MLVVKRRPDKKITGVKRIQDTLILYSEDGLTKLEPKSSNIIRIVYTLKDNFSGRAKPGVVYNKLFSGWDFNETEHEIKLNTGSLSLVIDKNTASIRYYDQSGKLLLGERDYESRNLEEFDSFQTVRDENIKVERIVTPDGIKEVVKEAPKVFDRKLYRTRLYLNWQEGEALYGLGQHEEGYLNLRGKTVFVHQANKKIGIPFLVSSLGYGILMDTYSPMIFNDTNSGSYFYTEADEEMDYYFIYGVNMDGVIRGYRQLTGKAVMLPKWAFGFIQSRERYETAEELNDIVKEHRKRKIGLDGIVLDWCSWEGELWGQKTFDKERFADPAAMMEELHGNHAYLMMSVWPNMSKECDNYREFEKEQLLLPASSIYDPFREEGRKLYWKQAEEGLFRHGVDAWWCDSSEPFTPEWNHMGKPEPSTMYHEFYDTASRYIPAELTNSYGLFHARTIYEGQREETEEKRVVNLTRNGYTGQQRYGAILWSGDISADWTTMKRQIAAGLNFCASGIPYWTLDIGAFFVKKGVQWFWDGDYEKGYDNLGYRELFTRWFQYGCFLPVFRSHGTDCRRELWNFGDPGNMFYDALIKMNQLRYRLMPYIYSLAAKVWKDDYTMLRLLAFDFPQDAAAREIDDQFLFGDSLMVCPVTRPMYYDKGSRPVENAAKTRRVYLPEGTGWYDFWTEEYYEGGQVITADAPIDRIPIYVKTGSIIPMTCSMQYVDEIPDAPIEVWVYPGRDAVYELYEDEGNSYRYEKGEYTITIMTWSEESRELKISEPSGSYPCMVKIRTYHVKVISER
ncbi:TIM-barrel domain-containing protein [Anaerocolumna jejuensis]|uniref:glycoside hydrolase family 31 protein n=1 Tax=Anaerocolumna jejuensis TaxID=259063 RepID=UPI003F7B7682